MHDPRTGDRLLGLTILAMIATDIGFILYWTLIIIRAIPPEVMFEGYDDPQVSAWNWSFFPLDIAAAITGLIAVRALRRGSPAALPGPTLSLALTATAGGMAIAYWAQLGQYDPTWMLPNLALLLFPLPLLVRVAHKGHLARTHDPRLPISEAAAEFGARGCCRPRWFTSTR
jgi:hypothetical protein